MGSKLKLVGSGFTERIISLVSLEQFSSLFPYNISVLFRSILFFSDVTHIWCEQAIIDNS